MFHEHPQAYVIGEDGLSLRAIRRIVRHGRVKLGDQETSLRFMLVAHDVPVTQE